LEGIGAGLEEAAGLKQGGEGFLAELGEMGGKQVGKEGEDPETPISVA
jgi:hypothetical protein